MKTQTHANEREFFEWRERMKQPEERRRLFGMLAVASAFVGDRDRAEEYGKYAREADALCERPMFAPGLDYQI